MQPFTQLALGGAIVAGALGALALCVVLFLYGFRGEGDDDGAVPARRLLVIRLGHALAAAGFAAVVILNTAVLIEVHRTAAAPPSPTLAAHDEVDQMSARMQHLETRLAAAELRLDEAASKRAVAASTPAVRGPAPPPPARRPAATARVRPDGAPMRVTPPSAPTADPPVELLEHGTSVQSPGSDHATQAPTGTADQVAEPRPKAKEPAPASRSKTLASATEPRARSRDRAAADDLGAKIRDDWETVKDGFRRTGDEIRSGLTALGRRLKDAFSRD